MTTASGTIFYVFTFLATYVEVFFLVTFLENRKKIIRRREKTILSDYPAVTVMVPCWNEEKTVAKTVNSLLKLHYPAGKLRIILIDDGSTDRTWEEISKFAGHPNIRTFHKENGGKHSALNLALSYVETDFLGCLDADSRVDPESLARIMSYFEHDPYAMAVAPSIIVDTPKSLVQKAQKAEYHMAVYIKKMLGFLGAIHVTPGPLTIFRRKVFDDLGPYRMAHNTEDMEIAYRMQKHRYKIEQCNDAYVYTSVPQTFGKLYRQRLRWIYGFINNTIDYRGIMFQKKYGNFSLFTIPAGIISIFSVSYLFGRLIYAAANFLRSKIQAFQAVGFRMKMPVHTFDTFFINTHTVLFVIIFLYALVTFSIVVGHKMASGKWGLSWNMLFYFVIFSVVAPFWLMKAVYNTVAARNKPAWR